MEHSKITLTYLNIRQSIAILLAKLVFIDLALAGVVIGLYFMLVGGGEITRELAVNLWMFVVTFAIAGFLKIIGSSYVVLLWLNEYYEITPKNIIHKKGVIFRKAEMYDLDKIRVMDVQDSFLGELFNFATITLYDIRLQKLFDMYLIHNPERYMHVLKTLRPNLEIKKDRVRLPFMPRPEIEKDEA